MYLAASIFGYARLFELKILKRISLFLIFLSIVPLVFVLPSLIVDQLYGVEIWNFSWLSVLGVLDLYFLTDLIAFGSRGSKAGFIIELVFAGLLLTATVFLTSSLFAGVWSTALFIFVIYLAVVAIAAAIFLKKNKQAA